MTGLVGPGDELSSPRSLRNESCDMRFLSLKGESFDDLEDGTELPEFLDDRTVERFHWLKGSESGRDTSSSSFRSTSGDLAETKPESTLD